MKMFLVSAGLLFAALSPDCRAETWDDNFDREEVAETRDVSLLGPGYESSNPGKIWALQDGQIFFGGANTVARVALINTSAKTGTVGGGAGFRVQARVRIPSGELGGVVFNYQDADNFYYLALQSDSKLWELAAVVGGEWIHVEGGATAPEPFLPDADYVVSVEYSPQSGEYAYQITNSTSDAAIPPGSVSKSDMPGELSDGYGGLFGYSVTEKAVAYDDLKVGLNK